MDANFLIEEDFHSADELVGVLEMPYLSVIQCSITDHARR